MSERLYLTVPFAEKDQAKGLGARWDPLAKQWYVNSGASLDLFARWDPKTVANNGTAAPQAASLARSAPPLPPAGRAAFSGAQSPSRTSGGASAPRTSGMGAAAGSSGETALRLSQVLGRAQEAVASAFPAPVWILAEVDSIRKNTRSGHWYLEISERDQTGKEIARVNARVWSSNEGILTAFEHSTGAPLREGVRVLLFGQLDFSAQYGAGLTVLRLDPSWTLGEMQKKLLAIRKEMEDSGLAQRNRQLSAPADYRRVALIAPSQAAGLGDFMADANKLSRLGLCQFELFEAVFEGKTALSSVASAFKKAAQAHAKTPFDALAIIRGGGASASLGWLNELELAKATALFPIPVLAGIGHERDQTAIDEFARLSLDTPSKVIGLIISRVIGNAQQAQGDFEQSIALVRERVAAAEAGAQNAWFATRDLARMAAERAQANAQAAIDEVARQARFSTQMAAERTQAWSQEVLGMGPRQTLARGYALVRVKNETGRHIARAGQARKLKSVWIEFADGGLAADLRAQPVKKSGKAQKGKDQPASTRGGSPTVSRKAEAASSTDLKAQAPRIAKKSAKAVAATRKSTGSSKAGEGESISPLETAEPPMSGTVVS